MILMKDTRQVATTVIMAAIIGIVFYAAGYGHATSRALRREGQLTSATRAQQDRLAALKSRIALLRARIALYQAVGAAGQQNEATADGDIEQASAALAAVDAQAAGVDPGRLSLIQGQLRGFELQQSQDPQAQQSQIQALGAELGKLIAGPAPERPSAAGSGR